MPSQTKENYLKALYHLEQKDTRIALSELSKMLEVSPPSANHMVRRLEESGWISYEKYKPIRLTDQGRHMAAMIVRKHRLAEMFLTQIMGLGWEEVHDIAEELEHVQSDRFFDRMDDMLGTPSFDPHGSPIPDKDGDTPDQALSPLSQGQVGERYILGALRDSSSGLLHHLNGLQIKLGEQLLIISKVDFDGSMIVRLTSGEERMLSDKVIASLMVVAV